MTYLPFGAAHAQSTTSPFQPALTDPRQPQRFQTTDQTQPGVAPPSGAGDTGFDLTGTAAKKKKAKKKAGDPKPPPPAASPGPGAPQKTDGTTPAQQIKERESYANIYQPPDALPRRPPVPVQDPYDPLGVRVGTFLLKPSIEITRGHDSNPAHFSNGKGSDFTTVETVLQGRSQWSRNEVGFDLRGSYSDYDSLSSSNRPMLDTKAYTRIDASRDTAINLEGRYLLSTDYPGSPNIPVDIAKLPIFTTVGGTAGFTQRFNRLELSAKASIDRTEYQDSKLTDGSTSSNTDRDFNQLGGALRAGYEVFPGVKPFVEVAGDTRTHDLEFDRNGFQRDSRALTPRVGTTFEISKKLTGEVSVGYLDRHYQDPNLPDLRGVVADASLKYEISGLTTATLTATSRGDEIVVAGTSGVLRRDVGIQIDHALRRWLIWTVRAGYGFDDYFSSPAFGVARADQRVSLGSAITYKLSREVSIKGEYRYDRLRSNTQGVDYDANAFLIGLKLQR